jgi:hypothetical protein
MAEGCGTQSGSPHGDQEAETEEVSGDKAHLSRHGPHVLLTVTRSSSYFLPLFNSDSLSYYESITGLIS